MFDALGSIKIVYKKKSLSEFWLEVRITFTAIFETYFYFALHIGKKRLG
jgi:D-alanyl-lipoteichoic acid acyltransferase DltB (MBOAT superfamily)